MSLNGKSVRSDFGGSLTDDTFFEGALRVLQLRDGYRFSIDAVLLAAVVAPRSGQVVVDLGTGCGIIPLMLALRHPQSRYFAVELQPDLAELARLNVLANRLDERITVLQADIRGLTQKAFGGPVDGIVANPPYRRAHAGRINPNDQKACARHEIHLTLADLADAAGRLLRTGGRLTVIYPAERLADLFTALRTARIEPKWLRTIHSRSAESARLVLVQAVKAGRPGLAIHAPLVIYLSDGGYTPEVMALYNSVDTAGRKSY